MSSLDPVVAPARVACLFVDQLTVIDCARLDAVRGLVGESWIVDIELRGRLDAQSMVLDFGEVKRRLKRAIDASVDHTLILPLRDRRLRLDDDRATPTLHYASAAGPIRHRSPACALTEVDAEVITPAALEAHLQPMLRAIVPENVAELRLRLRDEVIDGARYHYVHGLKKHDGHCQRIAHGHRSRIEVRLDGERAPKVEARLAERWHDIYLGSREDLVGTDDGRHHYAYDAPEGRFELSLPAACCALLDADSTVECIAEHLADRLAAEHPGRAVEVRAFEGVMKGAIAERG